MHRALLLTECDTEKAEGNYGPSKEDIEEAETYFMALDASGDGILQAEEVQCGLSDLGFNDSDIADLIVKLDTTGDGTISMGEFVANYSKTPRCAGTIM